MIASIMTYLEIAALCLWSAWLLWRAGTPKGDHGHVIMAAVVFVLATAALPAPYSPIGGVHKSRTAY